MRECNRPVNAKALEVVEETTDAWASKGVVVLTAAAHNEVALADVTRSGKGSLFTQALYDIVNRAGRQSPTYQELRERIEKRIHEVATAYGAGHHAHHPQLEGDRRLFAERFPLRAAQTNRYQEMFEQLVEHAHFPVTVRSAKDTLPLGETQTFMVGTPQAGYLHLVEFDSEGNMNLLFPNDFVAGQQDRSRRFPPGPRRYWRVQAAGARTAGPELDLCHCVECASKSAYGRSREGTRPAQSLRG